MPRGKVVLAIVVARTHQSLLYVMELIPRESRKRWDLGKKVLRDVLKLERVLLPLFSSVGEYLLGSGLWLLSWMNLSTDRFAPKVFLGLLRYLLVGLMSG